MNAIWNRLPVLDLFSAAAGGWSLGMHRAGYRTVAACEVIAWRRAIYAQNNPGVRIYNDVRTLTADRLVRDGVELPWIVVGSPPCQDISPANTKGKGVDGERSGLFFEAIRIVGECRPRWVALENSANLRTRGADRVIAALEALGYTCWPFVVRAGHGRGGAGLGANHERPRSWLIAFNGDAEEDGRGPWRTRGRSEPVAWVPKPACRNDPRSYPDQNGEHVGSKHAEMGQCASPVRDAGDPWADWNGGLAHHLRVDDGISAWVAGTRISVSNPRGTSVARLIIEAYGDAVIPQIPEAIGRAILRVESALSAVRTAQ